VTRACWLIAASVVPFAVLPCAYGGFGLPKAVALQVLTGLVAAAWMLDGVGWPARRARPHANGTGLNSVVGILRSPVAVTALAFLVSQLIATVCSISPRNSFWGGQEGRWLGAVSVLCGYAIVVTLPLGVQRRRHAEALVSAILVGGSGIAAVGIAQRFWPGFPLTAWAFPRVGSTLGNPIFLGAYLLLIVPLAFARWIGAVALWRAVRSPEARLRTVAWSLVLAGLLACLLFTGSRGPWLGAVGAAVVFCGLVAWHRQRPRLVLATVILLAGVAALLLAVNAPRAAPEAVERVPYLSRLRLSRDTGSISERLLVWQGALDLIRGRPRIGGRQDSVEWLRHVVGYGPETTRFTFWTAYPVELFHHASSTGFFDRVHNRLLEVVLTTGVLGGVTFVAFFIALGGSLLRTIRAARSLGELLLPAALLSGIVGHVLQLQTGIETIETQTLLWIYAGLAIALSPGTLRERGSGDQALSKSLSGRPGKVSSTRGMRLACAALAACAGAVLVVALAVRGGREIVAASRYLATQDPQTGASEPQRLGLLNQAIALAPREPLYQQAKFTLHFRLGQGIPDADTVMKNQVLQFGADAIERAISLEPYEALYHVNRGELYGYWARSIDASKLAQASESWNRAIELSPRDADLRASLGLLYLETGHPEMARQAIEEAVKVDPLNGENYYVLGLVYREMGLPELAQQQFGIGYDVDERCVECLFELRSPRR